MSSSSSHLSVKEEEVLRRLSERGYVYEELCKALRCKEVKLPWSGEREGCKSLRYNMGLYTQCEKKCEGENCVECVKEYEKLGEWKYGTVKERKEVGIMEYKDRRGKGVVAYSEIMKKLGITREEVEKEAKRRGVYVSPCHYEEKKVKRGRPKKEKNEEPKKKRGRPRKEKEVVSNTAGEELIASLLKVNERSEEEEETEVERYEIGSKTYLKSKHNILYDIESHDCIGIWNENTKSIDEVPDEDD